MISVLLLGCFVLTGLFGGGNGSGGAAVVFFLLFCLSLPGSGAMVRVLIEATAAVIVAALGLATWQRGQNMRYGPPLVQQVGRHPQWIQSHLATSPPPQQASPPPQQASPPAPPRRPAPAPYPRTRPSAAQRWAGDDQCLFTHHDNPPTLIDLDSDQWR
jgi:hypothetical protein